MNIPEKKKKVPLQGSKYTRELLHRPQILPTDL